MRPAPPGATRRWPSPGTTPTPPPPTRPAARRRSASAEGAVRRPGSPGPARTRRAAVPPFGRPSHPVPPPSAPSARRSRRRRR
ncbi:hypothetical protein CA850_10775 [Micromonospora echinospora]|nr:hypothetical protein CA850_10775 [Micromonospora echinospora]